MTKEEIIHQLQTAHEELRQILADISSEIAETTPITPEGSTIKDILSHLIDWNIQYVQDFENVLNDTWKEIDNDAFNNASYEKRRDVPYTKVYAEWDSSIKPVIKLLRSLPKEQWDHVCKGASWHDGTPITIPSLFEYTYKGEPHELGHGNEIVTALDRLGL